MFEGDARCAADLESAARPTTVRASVIARGVLFACCFTLGALGVWLAAEHAADAAHIDPVALSFGLKGVARKYGGEIAADHGRHRVALIGDSTLMGADGMRAPRLQAVPGRVRKALTKYGERTEGVTLHAMRIPGLSVAGVYFISDELIAGRPDQVVLSFNLRSANREAMRTFSRPEMAGYLGAEQFLEALTLPLFDTGLTTDRLLLYRGLVAVGADQLWPQVRQLQARAFKLREPLADALDASIGSRASIQMRGALVDAAWDRINVDVDRQPRMSVSSAQANLAPVLRGLTPEHPSLRILAALLARFRRAQIPVLVYVAPTNMEHLQRLGLPLDGIPSSLRAVRQVVEAGGASFADFHDVLPDGGFCDAGDHYTFDGEPNGTFRLGRYIASAIERSMPAAPSAHAQYVAE